MTTFHGRLAVLTMAALITTTHPTVTLAQEGSLVRTAVEEVMELLTKQAAKEGSEAFTKELAEVGGEAAVRGVFEQVAKDSGEAGVNTLVKLTNEYGIDAIRAAEASPNITVKFIGHVSPEVRLGALRALARPGELAVFRRLDTELVPAALEASAKHPGVGAVVVEKLGIAGARASERYDTDAIIELVRSAEIEKIAALPTAEKQGLVELIANFVEQHPKTVLGSAALAVFFQYREQLLGGKGQVVIGPDGRPIFVPQTGVIERLAGRCLNWVLPVVAGILGLWGLIKCYWAWRSSRQSHQMRAAGGADTGHR